MSTFQRIIGWLTENPNDPRGPRSASASYFKYLHGLEADDGTFAFGGMMHELKDVGSNTLFLGQIGSGKSLNGDTAVHSGVCPDDGIFRHRLLALDVKQSLYPTLCGWGLSSDQIVVTDPRDARSRPIDFASDIVDDEEVVAFASILLPEEAASTGGSRFFENAALSLTVNLIRAFRAAGARWTLNDLVEVMQDESMLRRALKTTTAGAAAERIFFRNAKVAADTITTIYTKLVLPYGALAPLMARSKNEPFSVRKWARSKYPQAVLLHVDEFCRNTVGRLLQATFRSASMELSSQRASSLPGPTWVWLDELREVGAELDGLRSMLLLSRDRDVHVVAGFQSKAGADACFGKESADELVAQFGNVGILRMTGSDASWASEMLGRYEDERDEISIGYGPQGQTSTRSKRLMERASVMPSEFAQMAKPTREDGCDGVFCMPGASPWRGPIPGEFYDLHRPQPTQDAGFMPRPPGEERPLPLTPKDLERLGIPPEEERGTPDGDGGPPPPITFRVSR